MEIFVIFLLGIGNFALHRAVMESGHPLLKDMPGLAQRRGRNIAMLIEFAVLLAAMQLVYQGYSVIAWVYVAYSAINAMSAWLIVTRRI